MKRDREHRAGLGAEPFDLRHDAGGRDGDPPLRDRQPVAIGKHADRVAHIVEIIERLAHAHEDDVRDRRARRRCGNSPSVGGVSPGKSPSLSRATMSCATISRAERLRTSLCVPVWQKLQVSVQPTWLEMQSVPRSLSGNIDAFDLGALVVCERSGAKRSSHLRVPSCETCSVTTCGPRQAVMLGELAAQSLADVEHGVEARGALEIEPVPELRDAHLDLALGHAKPAQDLRKLGACRADERGQRSAWRHHLAVSAAEKGRVVRGNSLWLSIIGVSAAAKWIASLPTTGKLEW